MRSFRASVLPVSRFRASKLKVVALLRAVDDLCDVPLGVVGKEIRRPVRELHRGHSIDAVI